MSYVSTRQDYLAKLAGEDPERGFTSLGHYLDGQWLWEASRRVSRKSASGVDEVTAAEYEEHFDRNVASLLNRAKSGKYVAPPVRRVQIPKGDGKETRPIGIPCYEDKLLQRAVAMILEPIYEQDFMDCSFGFRPKRSAHQALQCIWDNITRMRGCWVLDVDIRKYFDTIDHAHLRSFLDKRVRDGVIRRLLHKWLKAGVWENGSVHYDDVGTPQGGVISPLFSNVYLHEVLDLWIEKEIKPRLRGEVFLVRYADDFVMGFRHLEDAERVLKVLPKRFERFGLTIHPEKTRLVYFEAPYRDEKRDPETFNFLGFTHYWGKSRRGNWIVKRKTDSKKYRKALKAMNQWCRENRHKKVAEQHKTLCQKLRGHFQYYGLTWNWDWLDKFRRETTRIWRKWLSRRTQNRSAMNWDIFNKLLSHYKLPKARITHRYA